MKKQTGDSYIQVCDCDRCAHGFIPNKDRITKVDDQPGATCPECKNWTPLIRWVPYNNPLWNGEVIK